MNYFTPRHKATKDENRKNVFVASRLSVSLNARGFSLAEVALALGVVAFAIIAIIGMVPVALDAAKTSRDETHATFIARSLLETLRSGENGNYVIESSPGTFSINAYPTTAGSTITHYSSYDADGTLIGTSNQGAFDAGGSAAAGAVFLARLTLTTQDDGLVHTEVVVEAPATAPRTNRRSFPFVTLINP